MKKYTILLKGLLITVVLFSCSPPSPSDFNNNNIQLDSIAPQNSIPDPAKYLIFGSGKASSKISDSLSTSELHLLKDGDILLRKGYGSISDYIADFLQEKYPITHCAFIINSQDNNPLVLHTVSSDKNNGMFVESIKSYCKQSQLGSLVLVRLKADTSQIPLVIAKAQQLVAQKVPFDMGFDDQDSSSLYCAEMVRNVLQAVYQKDFLPKRTLRQTIDVLSMDNFFDSTNFELIFNHFDKNKAQ